MSSTDRGVCERQRLRVQAGPQTETDQARSAVRRGDNVEPLTCPSPKSDHAVIVDEVADSRVGVWRTSAERASRERELASTPQTVPQPVHADFPYVEVHVKRVGQLAAGLTTYVAGAQNATEQPLEAQVDVADFSRDAYHAPGAPDLDIAAHAVQFPSDDALSARLAEQLVQKINDGLAGGLRAHGDQPALFSGDTLFNAGAGYQFGAKQQYEISLWGKNLTGTQYCVQHINMSGVVFGNVAACVPNEARRFFGIALRGSF